mmetsp:Transcript_107467/g.246026  ORF Transcript_107467/g.246026 Transcript_107467/m.246026 type:complete len:214 (+) Transcript_107467:1921-2562(+)
MGDHRWRQLIRRPNRHWLGSCPVQSAVVNRPRHCASPLTTAKLHRAPFSRRPRSSGAALWRNWTVFNQCANNFVCKRSPSLINLTFVHATVSSSCAVQQTVSGMPRCFATCTRRRRRSPTSLPARASNRNPAAREPAAPSPGRGRALYRCRRLQRGRGLSTARSWPTADVALGTRSCQRQPCSRIGTRQQRRVPSAAPLRFRLGCVALINLIP